MLVLLLLLHFVLGNDTPKNKYITDNIDTCPDIGYYFKRESNTNAIDDSCYLCFCQNNGTAVCWPRDNRRCDKKYYYHAGRRKRDSRLRRSPAFTDIFFRDAARDVFNRQLPEQCKPYESSFSEGCPPADWCIGCTVCDCDANGRWDCHILSFCSDNKGKKQVRKRKSSLRNKITKRQLTPKTPTPVTAKKSNKKTLNANSNKNQKTKQSPQTQYKKQINSKNKKKVEMQKKKAPLNKSKVSPQKKAISTKKKTTVNQKSFQQNKKPNQPKNINTNKSIAKKTYKNDTAAMIADTIFKKVMASVEKILYERQKNASKAINNKVIQKRSMSKQMYKNKSKQGKVRSGTMNKVNKKQRVNKVIEHKQNEKLGRYLRRKREVSFYDSIKNITQKENLTTHKPLQQMDLYKKKYNIKNEFVLLNATSDKIDELKYFHYTLVDNHINDENKIKITKPNEVYDHITTTGATKSLNLVTKKFSTIVDIENSLKMNYTETLQDIVNTSEKVKENFKGERSKKNITCGKICAFKKYWKNKIFDFRSKSSTAAPNINKKGNILDKIKLFLGKIFKKEQTRGNKTKNNKQYPFRKHNFIKILCKSIDSCKYNATDKLLHSKFNQLKVESNKIIKSVKIIKGLLKLLSLDKTNVIDKLNTEKKFKNNDEKVLTAILKNEYEAYLCNLTETQRIQIRYVKENTLIFIQSVENFANILSDLVDILSKKYNKKKSISRRYHRCLRKPQNTINNNESMSQKLGKLKNLLTHYNLVQNRFMKQMYEAITALNSTKNTSKIKKIPKVSYKNENKNNAVSTDIYIENIIKNLRKLKELAEKLSSKSRRKRSALDDDHAIEYLLTLMEYILKQNRPLDAAPAKDGIDLIIEAIKHAPDAKSVKKKVLDYSSTTETTTYSVGETNTNNKSNYIQDTNKLRTFESIDKESEMMMESHLYDMKYNDKNILAPAVEIKNDLNKDINSNNHKTNSLIETKQKFEIFFDDDDDATVENVSKVNLKDSETSATTESNMFPTRSLRPLDRNANEFKGRIKLDWIDENVSNERHIAETSTEKISKVTRTIKQKERYANAISSMTSESVEKNDKLTVASDEVYKRQMNLFNSLDYGTERTLLGSNSKEDKYNVDTFPMYFA